MKSSTSFIKNGLLLTLSSLFLKIIGTIFNIFLSNKIPSSSLGSFGILMSIFVFLLNIACSGINLSTTRLISEELLLNKKGNTVMVIFSCLKYCLFFSIISITLVLIFSKYVSNTILGNKINVSVLYLFIIILPLCSFSSCLCGYFLASNKIMKIIISQILEQIVQIIVTFLFLNFGFCTSTNVICLSLILGMIISEICSFGYLAYNYYIDYKKYNNYIKTTYTYTKRICKISLPIAFTTYIKSGLSTIKHSLIPISFLKFGLSYEQSLSYYGIISNTVMTLLLFPITFIQSYSNLLIPELSNCFIKKDIKKIIRISKKSIYMTFLFSVFVAIILIFFAHFIDIYFYKTLSVEHYIKILAPIIIYMYMDSVTDTILKSLDLQVYSMTINIIDLITSIIFIKYLIPLFGVPGYLFILYFSETFNFILSILTLKYKASQKIKTI